MINYKTSEKIKLYPNLRRFIAANDDCKPLKDYDKKSYKIVYDKESDCTTIYKFSNFSNKSKMVGIPIKGNIFKQKGTQLYIDIRSGLPFVKQIIDLDSLIGIIKIDPRLIIVAKGLDLNYKEIELVNSVFYESLKNNLQQLKNDCASDFICNRFKKLALDEKRKFDELFCVNEKQLER